jgi:hypothetical protein
MEYFSSQRIARARTGLGIGLLYVAFTTSTFAFAADPVKIGIPIALSGPASVVAPSTLQAAQWRSTRSMPRAVFSDGK